MLVIATTLKFAYIAAKQAKFCKLIVYDFDSSQ